MHHIVFIPPPMNGSKQNRQTYRQTDIQADKQNPGSKERTTANDKVSRTYYSVSVSPNCRATPNRAPLHLKVSGVLFFSGETVSGELKTKTSTCNQDPSNPRIGIPIPMGFKSKLQTGIFKRSDSMYIRIPPPPPHARTLHPFEQPLR